MGFILRIIPVSLLSVADVPMGFQLQPELIARRLRRRNLLMFSLRNESTFQFIYFLNLLGGTGDDARIIFS